MYKRQCPSNARFQNGVRSSNDVSRHASEKDHPDENDSDPEEDVLAGAILERLDSISTVLGELKESLRGSGPKSGGTTERPERILSNG